MKITIKYETTTLDGENKAFIANFDGLRLTVLAEFMDDDDKKEAVACVRSVANALQKKIDPENVGEQYKETDDAKRLAEALDDILRVANQPNPSPSVIATFAYTALKAYRESKKK